VAALANFYFGTPGGYQVSFPARTMTQTRQKIAGWPLGLLLAIPAAALFKLLLDTYYALPVE
jgi:hypothetical protein